ncbi:MAG: bifunctional UDP-sugar hydrolase/5'-nucleotidase [Lachnotalea sp.]
MKKRIKIYFTSDIHGYFYPTNYADRKEKELGLLKCANQFEKDGNTLIMDGGDILQGSAFTYYCQKELQSNQSIAQIMNLCGYDYVTLGNHDFNYGQQYFEDYIDQLNATCVCQNVSDKKGEGLYPYDIRTMDNGIQIGIVGIVTDYVNVWEKKENIDTLSITNPFEAAKRALEELKDKVDLTICIYHGGFEKSFETGKILSTTSENIAYRICEELGFDLLLTGHQHMSMGGKKIHGTYVVQPKEYGMEYQMIEVLFVDKRLEICSQIQKAKGECNLEVYTAFYKIEEMVQKWLDQQVGKLSKPLLPDYKIKMAMDGSVIADFLNQIQLFYSGAQISATSLGNDVKGFQQNVTRRDIIATYPYSNTLIVCEITGMDLKNAIEYSAQYFNVNEAGDIEVSEQFLEPKVEHYNFDFYFGIEYRINPQNRIGERVTLLKYKNKIIAPNDIFTICINNYRASGAGGYHMYPLCKVIKEINIEMVELILDYFEIHADESIREEYK